MTLFGVSLTESYTRRHFILMALFAVTFIAMSQIGSALFNAPAVLQPAAGLALAFITLEGIMLWPALAAAATLNVLISGFPLVAGLGAALGHTLHAVVGAYILRHLAFDPIFRRIRDMLAFMATIFISSALVPLFGFAGVEVHKIFVDPTFQTSVSFGSWWMGIFLSDLIVGALIIRWGAKPHFIRTRLQRIETALALMVLTGITYLLYWTPAAEYGNGLAIILYLIPFIWFVLRLGMRFTLLGFTITTFLGIAGILYGYQPTNIEVGERVLVAQFFIAALAVIFYLFVAVVEERQRAARDLNAQLERVKALLHKVRSEDTAKSEFLAIFSHELRNPLAPIVSSLELLQLKGTSDPAMKRTIDIIDERVRVIVRLLDDLLDISRISRKTFKLKREDIELQSVIEQSVRSVKHMVTANNLRLNVHMPEEPVIIHADPVRIEQVLINLLNNAAKYTHPGGSITLSLGVDAHNFASISVKDTGIGINPDMLKRIFEPFLQLEKSPKQRVAPGGLGIGLSLTEKLVVMHGGTIEAKSEGEEKGSEFIVRFPRALVPTAQMTPASVEPSPNPLKVMVVDDNEAAAYSLSELLTAQGHSVDFAHSGIEAIQKTLETKPEAVILDIGLPDVDGYNVARVLREEEEYKGILVAVTGYGQEEDRLRAMSVGFDANLTKPVNIGQLVNALALALRRA